MSLNIATLLRNAFATPAHFRWEVLHLRQTIFHGQYSFSIVDVNTRRKSLAWDRGSVNIHQPPMRMKCHEMPSTLGAELAIAFLGLLVVANKFLPTRNPNVLVLEQREGVNWPRRP